MTAIWAERWNLVPRTAMSHLTIDNTITNNIVASIVIVYRTEGAEGMVIFRAETVTLYD